MAYCNFSSTHRISGTIKTVINTCVCGSVWERAERDESADVSAETDVAHSSMYLLFTTLTNDERRTTNNERRPRVTTTTTAGGGGDDGGDVAFSANGGGSRRGGNDCDDNVKHGHNESLYRYRMQ